MQATYAYVCQLSLRFIELFTLITMPALKSQCIFTFFFVKVNCVLDKTAINIQQVQMLGGVQKT